MISVALSIAKFCLMKRLGKDKLDQHHEYQFGFSLEVSELYILNTARVNVSSGERVLNKLLSNLSTNSTQLRA